MLMLHLALKSREYHTKLSFKIRKKASNLKLFSLKTLGIEINFHKIYSNLNPSDQYRTLTSDIVIHTILLMELIPLSLGFGSTPSSSQPSWPATPAIKATFRNLVRNHIS
jgi:hypothetical protein